jgi:hypothetical protein
MCVLLVFMLGQIDDYQGRIQEFEHVGLRLNIYFLIGKIY